VIVAEQNGPFEGSTYPGAFVTGLTGTLGVRILDNMGNTVVARTTAGIGEHPNVSTIYFKSDFVAPGDTGQYTIAWDDGSGQWATEDLVVVEAGSSIQPIPPTPTPAQPAASSGPCSSWVDGDYVLEICSEHALSTDPDVFEPWIAIASDLLFRMSGRQFPGSCSHTVRPCGDGDYCMGWAWPLTARETGWYLQFGAWGGAWGWYWPDGSWLDGCGCHHVHRVRLPDYPVLEVTSVQIDGAAVDPDTYALREFRYLDRLDDGVWPHCQDMRRPLGEDGTWGVTYTWGAPIPAPGVHAAAVLACEFYADYIGGECRLPKGVTQLTRQGVSMSQKLFAAWGLQNGQWATGLPEVDAFLQTVNPYGLVAPTTVWSPDLEPFPRPDYA
jgi:hypothetical protein